ncbi:hypothetical protein CVT26_007659 [Gymnopilus dilepis]|uniref:Uncharacterized protein n=1 Tax=Gymnopilus dilepis TaxID=231916 RepID=A0A409VZP3_9AGAR|nr:hypothetical protein CVT26_007659 [Gymnopilus dilepis]
MTEQSFYYQVVPLHLFSAPRHEQMPKAFPEPLQFQGFNSRFHDYAMQEEVGDAIILAPRMANRGRQGEKRGLRRIGRRRKDL